TSATTTLTICSSTLIHGDRHSFPTRRSSDLINSDNGSTYVLLLQSNAKTNSATIEATGGSYVDATGITINQSAGGMLLASNGSRSEEHTSEPQSLAKLVCGLLLEDKASPFYL